MTKYTKEEKEFMKNYVPGHSHKEIKEEFLKRFGYIPCKSFPSSYIKNEEYGWLMEKLEDAGLMWARGRNGRPRGT